MLRTPVLALLLLLPGAVLAATEPLSVFVSVVPQRTFVERVGGDWVKVEALVEPGANPHLFEPRPRQVAALSEADLYIRIGASFEDAWMSRIQATNPGLRVLDAREGIALRPLDEAHEHDDESSDDAHGHEHEALDNHVWTSPPLVKVMVGQIRDALSALAPEHAEDFAANADAFVAELDALDAEIRALLADLDERRFLVFHPAWGYYADTYGLTQVAIEREGKEPGPRALAAVIEQARREGIRVVLVQPQMSARAAEEVARAIGGRVAPVDPLAADYAATLRALTRLIAGVPEAGHE
ncbi:MAG: zinc ABC transporter substrate-binding protein [Chromatiaceae bacterium]|nr:zinc ABC transporter substrate-binding protein [Chromatiaceae bacterium]